MEGVNVLGRQINGEMLHLLRWINGKMVCREARSMEKGCVQKTDQWINVVFRSQSNGKCSV